MKRWFSGAIAVLLLAAAVLAGRMIYGAIGQTEKAAIAGSRGQDQARIRHLRRAMACYFPGNPWVKRAKEDLAKLAREAEARQNFTLALNAWRELRSAIMALRHVWRPFARDLPQINRRIALLSGKETSAAASLKTERGRQRLLERLSHAAEPAPIWTFFGLLAWLAWVAGAVLLAWRGFACDLERTKRFWPLFCATFCSLLLFCVCLRMA